MKRALLFIFTTLAALALQAQSFKADISDVGQYYRLTFTVNSQDVSDFTPPSLAAFKILSGPNSSTFSNFQMINGKTSHSESTTFTYILAAKKSGKTTIGRAAIQVGNKKIYSRPLTLNVHAGASNAAGGSSSANSNQEEDDIEEQQLQRAGSRISNQDLFIDAIPSRTRIREQEAVLITYKVHARVGVGLANTQMTEIPDFKGFISQEIPLPGNQIQTSIEHRNGTTYRTGTILQYVLFPQKNGKLEIPALTFDCTVVQQKQHMSLEEAFFNGGGHIGVQVKRRVSPISIQVDALPAPKPTGFSGGVGRFNLKGEMVNKTVRTNDIATYRITLDGVGNLKLITAPNVTFPQDFDTYDAKSNQAVETTTEGLKGKVTFDYTFVPRNIGKYTIPAIEFVYFNTATGKYETLKTQPVTLDVKKGERSNADVDKQLALLKSDIRNPHPMEGSGQLPRLLTWGTWECFVFHLLLIAAFIGLLRLARNWKENHANTAERKKKMAEKLALKELEEAKALLETSNSSKFYTAISKALTTYVQNAFEVGTSEVNAENIRNWMTEKGVNPATISLFTEVLETCQFAQYAPMGDSEREEVYHKAVKAIEGIKA